MIPILQGQDRRRVGRIAPKHGMQTSQGRVDKTSPSSVVIDGSRYRVDSPRYKRLSVTLTEARKFGYPEDGIREIETFILRGGQPIWS